eukprot:5237165-Amphidinium_carterae.1
MGLVVSTLVGSNARGRINPSCKTREREHSYGEDNLEALQDIGETEEKGEIDRIDVVFPNAPSGKDRKTLTVSQIQGAGASGLRAGVPVE